MAHRWAIKTPRSKVKAMPDLTVSLLDLVMPHTVAADLDIPETELWQMVRRREFPARP
jgi:hypothetical protein